MAKTTACKTCGVEITQEMREAYCKDCFYGKHAHVVFQTLRDHGFQCYLVGGAVRDYFLGKSPKDMDFTTNALPEKIQEIFSKTVYTNKLGTVTVFIEDESYEVTTFRKET